MTNTPKKSMLPDLNELGSIASKLFKDLKKSITEISHNYHEKRKDEHPHKAESKETHEKGSHKESKAKHDVKPEEKSETSEHKTKP